MYEVVKDPIEEQLWCVADYPLAGRAHVTNLALLIERCNEIGRVFDQRPETKLVTSQRIVDGLQFSGGVIEGSGEAGQFIRSMNSNFMTKIPVRERLRCSVHLFHRACDAA